MGELFGAERRVRGRERHKDAQLTQSQFHALVVLEKVEQVTAGDLAKSADLNPASVTAMLDQLESTGIVARLRSTEDRRVCMVSLTEKGRVIVDHERDRWHARWGAHFADQSDKELRAALGVLQAMIRMMDEV
jgi:DNA-binding MarR family transcriptional regulator